MEQKFELVKDSRGVAVSHLYRYSHRGKDGNWTARYYARFKDWKGIRRSFPLGSDLKTAREEVKVLEARNIRHEDFAADKMKLDIMTLARWIPRYLDLAKSKKSIDRDRQHCAHLERVLGGFALSEIMVSRIMEYKNLRLAEPVSRYGKSVRSGAKVQPSTVNRELQCLGRMLRLGAREQLIESVPFIEKESERGRERERVLSEEEFKTLLADLPRWAQRVCVAAYETSWDRGDLLGLTWEGVDWKAGTVKLKGGRSKTGIKARVPISAPLFQGFREVLEELRKEQRTLPNTEGRVFTKDGRPMKAAALRSVFDTAKRRVGIVDFRFKDFRHTAITRWSAAGIRLEMAMAVSGHASVAMHKRYVNPTDRQLAEAFEKMARTCTNDMEGKVAEAAKLSISQ